jgi:hypothetical protein
VIESANDTVVAISLPARSASCPTASVELGDFEQLLRLLHRNRGVGFFVLVEQFDRTSHDAAGGIDLLHGEIETPPHLLADSGIGAAERRHHADLDRVGGTDAGYRGRREQRGKRRC